MRRKLMAGALALAMVASLVACGGEKKEASEGDSKRLLHQKRARLKAPVRVVESIINSVTHVWMELIRSL